MGGCGEATTTSEILLLQFRSTIEAEEGFWRKDEAPVSWSVLWRLRPGLEFRASLLDVTASKLLAEDG